MLTMRITLTLLLLFLILPVSEAGSCPYGYYGPTCALKCGEYCLNNRCEAVSAKGTFRCTHGCKEGYTGSTCDRKCPRGCNVCDLTSGECSECLPGRCGSQCDQLCDGDGPATPRGNCMDSACSQCRAGWRGTDCNIPCPQYCESDCDRTSGACLHQCVRGHHGTYCSALCTTTCNEGCRQTDGFCLGGCQTGWRGSHCNESCDIMCPGGSCFQNGECTSTEPTVGQILGESHCQLVWRDSGLARNCSAGCEPGWRGERCDQVCPQQCYSCSRYPSTQLCVYTADVVFIKEHGVKTVESEGFEFRLVYAMLLVIPPFLIVGLMQLFRVGYAKFKRYRDVKKRGYIVEDKTSEQKTDL